jgi:hypothetical protein
MNKTAMQELIEYLEKNYYINELTNFDIDKIQFLEKEKEQIENAYYGLPADNDALLPKDNKAEQYYNKNFKK